MLIKTKTFNILLNTKTQISINNKLRILLKLLINCMTG